MRKFTPEEDRFIRDHYLSLPANEIDRIIGRSIGVSIQRMKRLGIKVPRDIATKFLSGNGFKKGYKPHNKGGKKKRANGFDIGISKKKGQKPYLIAYFETGKKYLHRHIWEQAFGAIPAGYKIAFKDGNTLNCNLDNLEIVSSADLMKRNSSHRFGPEIFKIIQLRGALNRQINKKLKLIK